jgi:hypothetical protein
VTCSGLDVSIGPMIWGGGHDGQSKAPSPVEFKRAMVDFGTNL